MIKAGKAENDLKRECFGHLSEMSSKEEKISAFLQWLYLDKQYHTVPYERIYMPDMRNWHFFEQDIIETGMVEIFEAFANRTHVFELNIDGIKIIEQYGSYMNYVNMMNHVGSDFFYESDEHRIEAAKKLWPEFLYLCPEDENFDTNKVAKKFVQEFKLQDPREIFEIQYNLEILLKSKNYIKQSPSGNLHLVLTQLGCDAKDGVLKHRILLCLNETQGFYGMKTLGERSRLSFDELDGLTHEMKIEQAIYKEDISSASEVEYKISIAPGGKNALRKSSYLRPRNINPIVYNDHSIVVDGNNDGNLSTGSNNNQKINE